MPAGVEVRSLSIADGTATIDLSGAFDDGGGSAGMFLRLAQLVHTATQFPSVDRVALRIEGDRVKVFSSEGIELPETLARADVEEQAPAILVEQPAPGSKLVGPYGSPGRPTPSGDPFLGGRRRGRLDPRVGLRDGDVRDGLQGLVRRGGADRRQRPATLRVFERSAEDGSETKVVEVPIEFG